MIADWSMNKNMVNTIRTGFKGRTKVGVSL